MSDFKVAKTTKEMKERVSEADPNFIPKKSREKYLKAFDLFNKERDFGDFLESGQPSDNTDDAQKEKGKDKKGDKDKEDKGDKEIRTHIDIESSPNSNPHIHIFQEIIDHKKMTASCCLQVTYVVLGLIVVLIAIAEIAVTVITAVATKIFTTDMSGRLVAMVILAVLAAIVLSVCLYSIIGVCRKTKRPMHAAALAMVIIAVIQALICGLEVRVTHKDETKLIQSLSESFQKAQNGNPKHSKIWGTTQNQLQCCGLRNPEDYRLPRLAQTFAPDVPISCCPSYDPDRSDLVQEIPRQECKVRNNFYQAGCMSVVVHVFRDTAELVLTVTIVLIVLELVHMAFGVAISVTKAREKKNEIADIEIPSENAEKEKKDDDKKDKISRRSRGSIMEPEPPVKPKRDNSRKEITQW